MPILAKDSLHCLSARLRSGLGGDCEPATGSETCRLLPPLRSAPRFGLRRESDVLETQLPAEAKLDDSECDRFVRTEVTGAILAASLEGGSEGRSVGLDAARAGKSSEAAGRVIILGLTR